MIVTIEKPLYGLNYSAGQIGFISRRNDFIAAGIDWFTRWYDGSKIPICHTFIISGENQVIEAHAKGVGIADMDQYLNDPNVALYVRTPYGFNDIMAGQILDEAESHIGERYDFGLILASMLANCLIGRAINKLFRGKPDRFIFWIFNARRAEICSELVSRSLAAVPSLQGWDVLANPPETINPQQLFESTVLYQPGAIRLTNCVFPDEKQ